MLSRVGLVALLCGCTTTVTSQGFERGAFVRSRLIREDVTEVHSMAVSDGRLSISVARNTCRITSEEHERLENLVLQSPSTGGLIATGVSGGIGLGLIALEQNVEALQTPMLVAVGGVFIAIGAIGAIVHLAARTDKERVQRKAPGVEAEEKRECSDGTFTLREPVPWTLTARSEHFKTPITASDTTGAQGELPIVDALRALIAKLPAYESANALVVEGKLDVTLVLGKAKPYELQIKSDSVQEHQWAAWGKAFRPALSEIDLLWWDTCSAIRASAREASQCLFKGVVPSDVAFHKGTLAADASGAYGAVHELRGEQDQVLTFRMLAPAGWFVQVMDLETGNVLAEQVTKSARHDVVVTLPRRSDYMIVLNAKAAGDYRATLAVTNRKENR
jgi:hypothetical protein